MIEDMPAADRATTNGGERLRRARNEAGHSLSEFATELLRIRRLRGDEISHDTLRRRVVDIENGGALGGMWRADIAAVFGAEPDEFFGLSVQAKLPHPLLLSLPVDQDVLSVIAAQQQTHIRVEHMFGPQHAQSLVQHDLETVEALVKSTPADLRAQVRQAAGTIAEVAG